MSTMQPYRFTERERHELFLSVQDRIVKLQHEGGPGNNWRLHTLFGLLDRLSGSVQPQPVRDAPHEHREQQQDAEEDQ